MFNSFGKYKYRSAEDILEAAKPLCVANGALLTVSDRVTEVNGWVFVEATAMFKHGDFVHTVTAYARHPENKKGMDDSQVTGATSSYARKYALNGMFCIDDAKDADATNTHGNEPEAKPAIKKELVKFPDDVDLFNKTVQWLKGKGTLDRLKQKYAIDMETEVKLIQAAEI